MAGRPTKFDQKAADKILKAVRAGATIAACAAAGGISQYTFKRWRRRGEAGEEPFSTFCTALKSANQEGELRFTLIIAKAAETDPTHAKWMLERRWPKRWAPQQKTKVEMTSDKDRAAASRDELIARLKAKAAAALEQAASLSKNGPSSE